MASPPLICPTCKIRLNKIRISDFGSKYGCDKCGKWFVSGEPTSDAGDPTATSGRPKNQLQPTAPPNLHGLSETSIIMGINAATLSEAIGELVPKALYGTGEAFLRIAEITAILRERLGNGALSEFQHGLAFLHLCMDDLQYQRAAMGISVHGLSPGGNVPGKVFVVMLFLRPSRQPGYDVPLWVRRKLCNERMIRRLRQAPDAVTAFKIIQEA